MIIFYENKKEKGEKKEKKKPTYNSKALCKGDQRIAIAVAGVIRVCCLARQDCHRINISCSTSCKSQNKSKDFHHGGKKPIESPRRKLEMISRYLRHRRHCRMNLWLNIVCGKVKGKYNSWCLKFSPSPPLSRLLPQLTHLQWCSVKANTLPTQAPLARLWTPCPSALPMWVRNSEKKPFFFIKKKELYYHHPWGY